MSNEVYRAVRYEVDNVFYYAVNSAVNYAVCDAVYDAVDYEFDNKLYYAVRNEVHNAVYIEVDDAVSSAVYDAP